MKDTKYTRAEQLARRRPIVEDKKAGMSYAEIMAKYDIAYQTVRSVLTRAVERGWTTKAELHIRETPPKLVVHPSDAEYLERWKAKCIILPNGCWEWQGWKAIGKFMYDRAKGYPEASYRGKNSRLTRVIAGWKHGRPLNDEEKACHECDYPPCINPDHLWVGTTMDNVHDRLAKGRDHHSSLTECPKGHAYDAENTYVTPQGHRMCKTCTRAKGRIKNGWPADLAYSLPPVPSGFGLVKYFVYRPAERRS